MQQKQLRTSILQILYDERDLHPYRLNREELAAHLGKEWPAIAADVNALEQQEYLVTQPTRIKSHTLYILRITLKGIAFVENGMADSGFRKIDVFISSPGDLEEERLIVKDELAYFNRLSSVADHYFFRPLAYEERVPAEIGDRPQNIVDRHMLTAGSCDLFICMFGYRMGTAVLHQESGETFQSGTEYEFRDAYRHNQAHKKPYILLYRILKPDPAEVDPAQEQAINAFFKQFEGKDASFHGLYKIVRSSEEFRRELHHDIDAALTKKLL